MALDTDPMDFVSLYGSNGLGFLVQDTQPGSVVDRKNCVNRSYFETAGFLKAYWRRREFAYTGSSTPALQANVRVYNTPTTSGAVFEDVGRLYYRSTGRVVDVKFLGDAEWLERSATRDADAGYPDYARLVQTSSAVRIELNRPIIQSFIDTIGTLTLEYHIALALLSADTDTTVLPRNTAHLILPLAAWYYGIAQGDFGLADRMLIKAQEAKATLLRKDFTRTGRPRQLRPAHNYLGPGSGRRLTRREYVDV